MVSGGGGATVRRYALQERIAPLLPRRARYVSGTAADNQIFVEAVLHRYRAGIAWPGALWAMPERFGE